MKNGRLLLSFTQFVTAYPWWILMLVVLAVSAMTKGIVYLGFKNDYRVYFSKENP
jgi:hypothetical protein